ncbi:MAG: polysaccharide deacetylase family protein [Planctomycetes bacterium]|nr:polysaccharide deacetylase family protein [Planctomycetota bacterium]
MLCYHRVLPIEHKNRYSLPDLVVTPQAFEQHCLLLRRHYEVLPLYAAVGASSEVGRRCRPIAAITFDDGYQDNFKYAVPILDRLGIQATFFVITDLIGTARVPWYDRLACTVSALAPGGDASAITDVCRTMGPPDPSCPSDVNPESIVRFAKFLPPEKRVELVQRISCLANNVGDFSTNDLIMDWSQLTAMSK